MPSATAIRQCADLVFVAPRFDVYRAVSRQIHAILADYKKDPRRQQSDIKRGCFLYFLGALAFVSLVVFLFYFFYSRRHVLEREHPTLGSTTGLESR